MSHTVNLWERVIEKDYENKLKLMKVNSVLCLVG